MAEMVLQPKRNSRVVRRVFLGRLGTWLGSIFSPTTNLNRALPLLRLIRLFRVVADQTSSP